MNEMPAIQCIGLTKTFTSEAENLEVLRALDLEVPQGRSCSIMGSSGSGKSTLLAILGGLERFDAGEVLVGGNALGKLSEKDLPQFRSSCVGFVFQFHYLLKDFSALENVALPAYMNGMVRKEAWGRAEELLEKVGLADRKEHFPSELSGGERQRTAIARALINSPRVLLADEPTGNLDFANAESIRQLLFELPAMTGATLLVATHNADFAASADDKYLLSEGRLQKR
ncbi:MAG: ABC transporter ATP-binding protein [Spirochaetaceae bacterium]|nr:ABC transporter ATP-binding protein [Spirochaetaceae bacterium]